MSKDISPKSSKDHSDQDQNKKEDGPHKAENLEMVSIARQAYDELLHKAKEAENKYLLLLAESENARKRLHKERHEISTRARESLIEDFLAPIDHFENALKCAENVSDEVKNWAIGFEMILTQFKDVLAQNGITPIESVGKVFDPHIHEAVEICEESEAKPNTVIHEFVKGYKMGDRVIRPSKVKVAKDSKEPLEQINQENQQVKPNH